MKEKFSESYKKEIISKLANYLIKADDYKCVLNEDLNAINSYYYQAWDNIEEKYLKDIIEAVESNFQTKFIQDYGNWDILREPIDSVIIGTLDYKYVPDYMWAKKVNTPINYYIHILKCALEDKINYSIDETIEEDNSFLTINIDYLEDFSRYKPLIICYTEVNDKNSSKETNKFITNIFTDSMEGFSEGLNLYNQDQNKTFKYKEACDLIIKLINKKGFDYKLYDKDSINTNLMSLLMKLDIEIGSTITFADDKDKVLNNMRNANLILNKIKDELEIEF